jgi:hypothetical protein
MNRADPHRIEESDYPSDGSLAERMQFMLHYAILAPSVLNTQPWRFAIHGDRIDVHADLERWLKVADPEQRDLHISLGCAIENLLLAAEHFGFRHEVRYFPDPNRPDLVAWVWFDGAGRTPQCPTSSMFRMIPVRHTNHREYDCRPIPGEVLSPLWECASEEDVHLGLTGEAEARRGVEDLMVRADAVQFADPAFREELTLWINKGGFGESWLIGKLGRLALMHMTAPPAGASGDVALLMSAPVLGTISTQENTPLSQVLTGRVFERVALLAASFGVWCQPLSQIVQVPFLCREAGAMLEQGGRSLQMVFRMGFAPPERHRAPRRPLSEVLEQHSRR